MRIYMDNAATTRLSDTALAAMTPCFQEAYGNPSSLHTPGQRAAEKLAEARAIFARNLHADPREITFTAGGSEADNQAIRSAAALGARRGKRHIVSTKFEHHAVLHTLQALEREGYEVTLLDIPPDGVVTAEQVREAIRPDTCLVSVMFANNEIGTIQPIAEIGAVCRRAGVLFHTDAVQAAGHVPLDVEALQVDLLSLSAHKFHGPKGVGVLYARRGVALTPLIHGGAQERGKRGGTEDLPGICGAAAAFDEACASMARNAAYLAPLRDRLIAGLTAIPHTVLNGDAARRLPGNVNVCFEGIEGESLLLLLDEKGIAASSGSACTSGSLDPSHVLLALGRPHEVAHGSLRLTLSAENRPEEIDYLLEVLPGIVSYLRDMSPVWDELETGRRPHLI
ncbi:MAG TPA: aminotransferase class V-fold PLP-dependent enzyme [Candidatus Oscillibacter excrementigallinarum]|uniref:cysteine desulfurase n=1 Tax=Candidatus Oscillibacter excrementigallinarum TaxID=2838716 RepID=A0A9D2RR49_9FIRM|nr:aminotransferase class V-fold PLP-dependent enzyme [Candidatus Oscillibacter excrementigallinarum]